MPDDVAHYYDRNTRRFLFMGRAGSYAIHRELWGPGVETAREAARYVDGLVADEIDAWAPGGPRTLVDFGCGVGGTLLHLAERFPDARLRGITISTRQVEVARRLAADAGVTGRSSFVVGDFHTADLGVRAHALLAIEAFAHSDDADAFVANAARHLVPGGVLVVADDFLAADEGSLGVGARRRVEQFRAGWRVPGLCTAERLTGAAARHGLVLRKETDLTSFTRPGSRIRDRLVALSSPVFAGLGLARIPFFGNIVGGHALQVGLREGFIRYRLLVFRKPGDEGS